MERIVCFLNLLNLVTCKPKSMQEFTKRVSAQSPNPEMFNHCVVNDDKDYL
jgi:hypothetical protein